MNDSVFSTLALAGALPAVIVVVYAVHGFFIGVVSDRERRFNKAPTKKNVRASD